MSLARHFPKLTAALRQLKAAKAALYREELRGKLGRSLRQSLARGETLLETDRRTIAILPLIYEKLSEDA